VLNKQIVYLTLMICVPLVLLAWLGLRFAQQQEIEARQRELEFRLEQLRAIDQTAMKLVAERERELLDLLEDLSPEAATIRQATRQNPHVRQIFVLAADGRVVHPDPMADLSAAEVQFLNAFGDVLLNGELLSQSPSPATQLRSAGPSERQLFESDNFGTRSPEPANDENLNTPQPQSDGNEFLQLPPMDEVEPIRFTRTSSRETGSQPPALQREAAENPVVGDSGWYTWYWGRGLNLIFWMRRPDDVLVGVLLERSRWMADIVAQLPDTSNHLPLKGRRADSSKRVQLIDSGGKVVYQWGRFQPDVAAEPFAELALSQPLASWRLKYFLSSESQPGSAGVLYFSVLSSLSVVGLGLLILAIFIYREQQRHLREAAQRVTFVNQVSHELKTPLTNVRMYAELLESDLDQLDDPKAAETAQGRLSVIVSESQRLSRLIGNVLTFARSERDRIRLHPRPATIDEVISRVVEQFRETLSQHGVQIVVQGACDQLVQMDSDAVEQILVNLLSNVEKYATDGDRVTITCEREGEVTTITVADEGPGLDAGQREKIFQPFYRGSDRIERVAGTGIGLSIARQLARLHGGDLTLLDSTPGAHFEVRLHTPAEGAIRSTSIHSEAAE